MSDLISRQDAIDAVDRFSLGETDAVKLAFRMRDYLKRLSSAQPECKTGKWTWETVPTIDGLHTYTQVRCSECGERFITDVNYCPNCGADMRGKTDDRPNQTND